MNKIRGVGPAVKRDDDIAMKTLLASRIAQYLTILALLAAAGCATHKPAQKNYLFFPPAPDEPRIQYLMSFGSESDFGGPSRFTEFVAGENKILRPIVKPYGLTIQNGKIY